MTKAARQHRYYEKQKGKGKCVKCPATELHTKTLCFKCSNDMRDRAFKRRHPEAEANNA